MRLARISAPDQPDQNGLEVGAVTARAERRLWNTTRLSHR
jgi:hypothetical protein